MPKKPKTLKCILSSRLDELKCVETLTNKAGTSLSLSQDQRDNLAIAVTEAVGNAIVHGNKKNPDKKVTVVFQLWTERVEVSVTDEGEGFDPHQLDNPLDPDNLLKESGRGIFILKTLMDDVKFEFSPKGSTIRMLMKVR